MATFVSTPNRPAKSSSSSSKTSILTVACRTSECLDNFRNDNMT